MRRPTERLLSNRQLATSIKSSAKQQPSQFSLRAGWPQVADPCSGGIFDLGGSYDGVYLGPGRVDTDEDELAVDFVSRLLKPMKIRNRHSTIVHNLLYPYAAEALSKVLAPQNPLIVRKLHRKLYYRAARDLALQVKLASVLLSALT